MRLINRMRPTHPAEILREDFVVPLGMNVKALALALDIPATRLHEILRERRAITADTAFRLSRYFDTTPEFWMKLQAAYDLKTLPTREEIERDVEPRWTRSA
jgi:addiction module HigA family antidote